ncbi:MAG TPA: DUF935 family protein [Bacteroidota bacterium]|nr:DUF935 family protein [Bacteroidota bacterium]
MPKRQTIERKKIVTTKAEPSRFADPSNLRALLDEQAPILNDYIRQYVGTAMPAPTPLSGVFLNKDRVWATQVYMELYGYDLYDEVERDPHVSAIMGQRKLTCAGLDYRIVPSSNSSRDANIAAFIDQSFDQLTGVSRVFLELLDAIGKGFSVSEILWSIDPSGAIVPAERSRRYQRSCKSMHIGGTLTWM